jgi:hypothetical protein
MWGYAEGRKEIIAAVVIIIAIAAIAYVTLRLWRKGR